MAGRNSTLGRTRPLVGVAVDAAMGHGRSVLRGVMAYANVSRRWLIHQELRIDRAVSKWPACDGSIVATTDPRLLAMFEASSRHLVNCSGGADPAAAPVVCMDDYAVGLAAAGHLMDLQLPHFGFYGRLINSPVSDRRLRGFREGLAARSFECNVSPVDWPMSYDWTDRHHWPALTGWLKTLPKPIGILAMDDASAHDLAAACVETRLNVPERIAIIGVNNDDLLCDSAWPPLSSVATDASRIGYKAAQLLDRLIRGRLLRPVDRLTKLPPIGVVSRVSTDTLAIEDRNVAEAVRYIREHACGTLTVPQLLRQLPVNRRWLERQFLAQLGRTPHGEIIRVRVEAAKRMLLAADVSGEQIAVQCGFGTAQTLGRQFLRAVGQTPAEFRRSVRGPAASQTGYAQC